MSYKPDISLKAIGRLSTPILMANFAIMGSAVIDTLMAGHFGAEHIATVAVGNAICVMVVLSFVCILQSLSPIAGHLYGAKRFRKIGYELTQSLWLSVPIALLGFALLWNADFWIRFSHLTRPVAEMTRLFLFAAAFGVPAVVFSRPYLMVNAAVNRPKVAMWISFGTLIAKVPLNYVFMFGALGVPSIGGAGAAFSTCVCNYLALVTYYLIWKHSRFYDSMRAKKFFLPNMRSLWQHIRIGVPIALSVFFECSSFTLIAIFIARLGTFPVASHQVVANIIAAMYQVPHSLGIACSVLVAQCCGAQDFMLARRVSARALKIALTIAMAFSLFLFLLREPLVSLYTDDIQVISLAVNLLTCAVFYHIFDTLQAISSFALRGYKITFLPMIICAIFLWTIGIGGGYWLGFGATCFGGPYGAMGFWVAMSFGLCLSAIGVFTLWNLISRKKVQES